MKKILLLTLMFLFLISSTSASIDLMSNLTFYYRGNYTGTTYIDVSNTLNATASNSRIFNSSGKINEGINLSKGTDSINFNAKMQDGNAESWTYGLWARFENNICEYGSLFAGGSDGSNNKGVTSSINASCNLFIYSGGGGAMSHFITWTTGPKIVLNDSWNHIVYSYNGAGVGKFYLNGVLNYTASWNPDKRTDHNTMFGCHRPNLLTSSNPNGLYDELFRYQRQLSDAEVLHLYNAQKGGYSAGSYPTFSLPVSTISLNWIQPINNSQVAEGGYTIVQATINHTIDTTCSLNGTDYSINYTGNSSSNFYYQYPFNEGDLMVEKYLQKKYNHLIICTNVNETLNWTRTSYKDNIRPYVNLTNQLYSFSSSLIYNFTVHDTFLGLVNVTDTCGNSFQNTTAQGLPRSNYSFYKNYNYNTTGCGIGLQTTTIYMEDAPNGTALNTRTSTFNWNYLGVINITAQTIGGLNISNFSIYVDGVFDGNTTNGEYLIEGLEVGSYNILINPIDPHQNDNITISVNSTQSYQHYNFKLYTMNSLNITIYNAETLLLISGVNISIEFIGTTNQKNITNTSKLYVDLLSPDEYTILTELEGYRQNRYIITIANKSFQNLNLYLQNSTGTSLILLNVQDRFGNNLKNAEIIIQRWINSAWITEQIVNTDQSGLAEGYYKLSTTYYNHIIKYNGITYFGSINDNENKKVIYAEDVNNGISFKINVQEFGEDTINYLQLIQNVGTILTISNSTFEDGRTRLSFTTSDNSQVTGKIIVTHAKNNTIKCTNSTTTSTGTLFCDYTSPNKELFISSAYIDDVLINSESFSLGVEDPTKVINWGGMGYFIGFILVSVSFFIFLSVPTISLYVGTGVFGILVLLGFMFKGLNPIVLILFLAITYFIANINSDKGANA
jgi:hypothetical protein